MLRCPLWDTICVADESEFVLFQLFGGPVVGGGQCLQVPDGPVVEENCKQTPDSGIGIFGRGDTVHYTTIPLGGWHCSVYTSIFWGLLNVTGGVREFAVAPVGHGDENTLQANTYCKLYQMCLAINLDTTT